MKLSIREQLEALGFKLSAPIKGGYKEPLIFLNVSRDVLDKCRCTKYGHARTTRKPKDFRPNALRNPVLEPIVPADIIIEQPSYADEYGVAFGAVA